MSKVNDASLVQENGAMQLLEEIIELAVDDNGSLSALLRKCLVLSFRLKNERLRMWADKELDYTGDDALPDYREAHTHSKGHFWGSMGSKIENYAIPTVVLDEEHRELVEKAFLREGIAAYQLEPGQKKKGGYWAIPWSPTWSLSINRLFSRATTFSLARGRCCPTPLSRD